MSPLAQLALAYSASAGFIAMAVVAGPHEPPIVVTGEAHHNHELVRQSVNIADLDLTTAVGHPPHSGATADWPGRSLHIGEHIRHKLDGSAQCRTSGR